MSDSAPADNPLKRDLTFLQAAGDCIELWDVLTFPLSISAELERKFRVCFPLLAHSANHVATALEVYRRRPLVASSSARIAFESALSAQWVLLTHQGEDVLVQEARHQWLVRTKEFSAAIGHPQELAEIVATEPVDGKLRSWSINNICARFCETSLLYDVYRDLTQAIHPSYGLVQAHIELQADSTPSTVDRTGSLKLLGSTAEALGLSAVLALDALGRMQTNPDLLRTVEQIAGEAGLPSDLALSDGKPHLQRGPA